TASEPFADTRIVALAAQSLGLDMSAVAEAVQSGLCTPDDDVVFNHPLARSAVYRAASIAERRTIHDALARVTGPDVDSDRHAWHMARAAQAPNDAVARDLEMAAGRSLGRGAPAAAAAFQKDAAAFAEDQATRSSLTLAAAYSEVLAGEYARAQS